MPSSRTTRTSRQERRARAEAARLELRRQERRKSIIVYSIGGGLALIILAAVILPIPWRAYRRAQTHEVGYVASVSTAAKAAGCTGVRNDPQLSRDNATTVDYLTLLRAKKLDAPPSSGPSDPNGLPDTVRFYPRTAGPAAERAVRNLQNGFVVAWYDAQLPAADVTKLQDTANQAGSRFIAVPWDRSVFGGGRHLAFTAWDRTQRCRTVSSDVLTQFAAKYTDPTSGQRWKSPTAPLTGGAGGTATPTASATPAPTPTGAATTPTKPTATPTTATSSSPRAGASPTPSPEHTVTPGGGGGDAPLQPSASPS